MKSWLALALLTVTAPALAAGSGPSLVELAMSDQTPAALALIDHGADVNAPSEDGSTALLWAAHRDDRVLVERLLKAHAAAKTANKDGATPMSEAAAYGDPTVMELLLKVAADPHSAIADAQTALMVV